MPTSLARRTRRLAARLGIAFFVLVLLGAGLELALRRGWIDNARYAREHAAVPAGAPASAEEARVLVLGDSFAIPLGGFGTLLGRELGARGVGLLNRATSGTGPFEYLDELTAAEGASLEVVLLSYYVGNDLTDVQNHPRYEGRDASRAAVAIDRSTSRPLLNRLYLYHYARGKWNRLRARLLDTDELARAGVDPLLIEEARALRMNPWLARLAVQNPNHLLDNLLRESEGNARAWAKSCELLDAIRAECARRGAELLVVAMPHTLQVDDSHADFFARLTYRLDPRIRSSDRPQDQLRAWCEASAVPLLDLLPELRAWTGEPLYLEQDDHLSLAGNRLAAARTVTFVAERLAEARGSTSGEAGR